MNHDNNIQTFIEGGFAEPYPSIVFEPISAKRFDLLLTYLILFV